MDKLTLANGQNAGKSPDAEAENKGFSCSRWTNYGWRHTWGLFPEGDATYLNYNGGFPEGGCYTATYTVPDNKAFWSMTVYGSDGYIKSDKATINGQNVTLNDDGTFTAFFGSIEACGDKPNRVDAPEGWNFLMRVYRPGASVLDGSYELPAVEPVV